MAGSDLAQAERATRQASSADSIARPRLVALFVGLSLCTSGAAHVIPFLLDDSAWSGPIGWRKAVTFGFSLGLTVISFAWITGFQRLKPRTLNLLLGTLAAASTLEYILITIQVWRGVPSHFNDETALDLSIWIGMGICIAAVMAATTVLAVAALARLDAPPSMALAIRAGMLLLFAGNLLGASIIANNYEVLGQRTADVQSIFGRAGEIKVPHAVALHSLQLLPLLAVLLKRSRLSEPQRLNSVRLASAGYAGLVLVSGLQAFSGRAPLNMTVIAGVLGVASVALLVVAVAGSLAMHVQLGLRTRFNGEAANTRVVDEPPAGNGRAPRA